MPHERDGKPCILCGQPSTIHPIMNGSLVSEPDENGMQIWMPASQTDLCEMCWPEVRAERVAIGWCKGDGGHMTRALTRCARHGVAVVPWPGSI